MDEQIAKQLLEKVKSDYSKIAVDFAKTRQNLWPDLNLFQKYFKDGDSILDLGCGSGRLFDYFNKKRINYTGIDNNKDLLKIAKTEHPRGNFILADQLEIPFENEKFNCIFNIASFHHIPSENLRQKALAEMKRVLKKDGFLILSVWNLFQKKYKKYLWRSFFSSISSFGKYGSRDVFIPWADSGVDRYYYAFKFNEIKNLLKNSAFEIIESLSNNNFYFVCQRRSSDDMSERSVNILGVKFNSFSKNDAYIKFSKLLKDGKQHQIVTPNPEFLLEAQKNEKFKKVLNNATLSLPDGIGILWASKLIEKVKRKKIKSSIRIITLGILGLLAIIFYPKYNKTIIKERVTGADFMQNICKNLSNHNPVFLLGAKPGIAEETALKLKDANPKLNIVGTYAGSPSPKDKNVIIKKLNIVKPEILYAAYNFPDQDIWIFENIHHSPTLKAAMGIGGAFDFITGNIKRAPKWIQKFGLEWLYRLILEPKKRIKRIYNAVIKFPILIIKDLLKG